MTGLTPEQRREFLEDLVAHLLATIVAIGFFSIVFVALLGFVDIKDPAVTTLVGTALGYAAAKMELILSRRYFRGQPEEGQ